MGKKARCWNFLPLRKALLPRCFCNYIIVIITIIVKIQTMAYNKNINAVGVESVIVYERFWKTLKNSGQTTYSLIKDHHISSSTIDKLRRNKPITTTTINDICRILGCRIEEIMEYVPSEDDPIL